MDLIDSMLVVDPEKRFTVDQCLSHPWLTQATPGVNDSTGGLVGAIAGLEVNRRAPARERTLLSTINSVEVEAQPALDGDKNPVKVYSKNKGRVNKVHKEAGPSENRAPKEFMEMGGKGDQPLFDEDESSVYPSANLTETAKSQKKKAGR